MQVLERFTDGGQVKGGALRVRVLLWVVFAAAVLALATTADTAALGVAALGAVLALVLLPDTAAGRVAAAAAIALTPLAESASVEVVLLVGAALVALAPTPRSAAQVEADQASHIEVVQRHLARARRRAERAHILLMTFADGESPKPSELTGFFRLTDSVSMRSRGGACEVLAVLDDHELDRTALERRIATNLASQPQMGWASFPDDGYTLGDLVHRARERQAADALSIDGPSPNGHHKTRLAS